jgi:hypothetical protein
MLAGLAALRARVLGTMVGFNPGLQHAGLAALRDGKASRQRRPTGERLAEQVTAWEEWEK